MWDNFPSIKKCALFIAYDNDMINICVSEQMFLSNAEKVLTQYEESIKDIEEYLITLSEEQLDIICIGDYDDARPLILNSPKDTEEILNSIFEEI